MLRFRLECFREGLGLRVFGLYGRVEGLGFNRRVSGFGSTIL